MSEVDLGATAKVLRILESLATSERPRPLGAIAEAAGLSKSTAHRILSTMVDMDFAERHPRGSYGFGGRFTVLAGAARDLAADPMVAVLLRLRTSSGRATVLAFKNSDHTRIAIAIGNSSTDSGSALAAPRVGSRIPLHTSAVGKCLLSGLPVWEIGAYFHRASLPSRTGPPIQELPDLLAELKQIRRLGYATENQDSTTRGIAVPVLNNAHAPIAAIGLLSSSCTGGADDLAQHLADLRSAATSAAAALLGNQNSP